MNGYDSKSIIKMIIRINLKHQRFKKNKTINSVIISGLDFEALAIKSEGVPTGCPALGTEEIRSIRQWTSSRKDDDVLAEKFNLDILQLDINDLKPTKWLNDRVVDFYMELLAERSRRPESNLPKVHNMPTNFWIELSKSGNAGVRNSFVNVDVFMKDIVLIPILKNNHWSLAVVNFRDESIKCYDSLPGRSNQDVCVKLYGFVKRECLDKKFVEIDMSGWIMGDVPNNPQQENDDDGGIFMCMYAEHITRNKPFRFSQQHMPYFRMKMTYEICSMEILN